jgi:hypothetical protein
MVANQFAEDLAKGDFEGAHALLTAGAKLRLPPSELQKQYRAMTDYGSGPATHVQVVQDFASWPGKQRNDVGWVYVAISGDTFSEAVTVVVSRENGLDAIRSVEWGRP